MLQVDKRKKRRNRKKTLALLLGILAAVSGCFAYLSMREKEPWPTQTDHRGAIVDREKEEIAWFRISVRGRDPWSAKRNGEGELVIGDDGGWVLDATLGETIEDALANLVYEDVLTENRADYLDRLEEFGLEEPALVAEVRYTDGTEMTIRVGNDSGLEDEDFCYMTVDGDDRLYAVAGSLVADLQIEEALLHPVVQPEIQTGRIDRITIRNAEDEVTGEWRLEGAITDADAAEKWRLTVPAVYPADQDSISDLKKNAGNLRLGLYVGEGTEENLEKYGLSKPARTIEIHMAAGATGRISGEGEYQVQEHKEETVAFLIGQSRNEMTDYCLYGGQVYTMNHFAAAALTELSPLDTAARYPVTVALENLSSLEIIRLSGEKDVYELTRTLQGEAEEEEKSKTLVTCRKNGEEINYEVFEASYERLLTVDVSGQLPEGWKKQETEITYVFRTLGGRKSIVELSPFDAIHDAVTLDGCSLFYLIRNGMGQMP